MRSRASLGKWWARYNNKVENKLLSNYNKNNHYYSVKQLKAKGRTVLNSTVVNYRANMSNFVETTCLYCMLAHESLYGNDVFFPID